MLRTIERENPGTRHLGWQCRRFHFSFASHYNPVNADSWVLRVINDHLFRTRHRVRNPSYQDREIVAYVVDRQLTHADGMGDQRTLTRG
jgi:quercetin 2,3-dioxygenase